MLLYTAHLGRFPNTFDVDGKSRKGILTRTALADNAATTDKALEKLHKQAVRGLTLAPTDKGQLRQRRSGFTINKGDGIEDSAPSAGLSWLNKLSVGIKAAPKCKAIPDDEDRQPAKKTKRANTAEQTTARQNPSPKKPRTATISVESHLKKIFNAKSFETSTAAVDGFREQQVATAATTATTTVVEEKQPQLSAEELSEKQNAGLSHRLIKSATSTIADCDEFLNGPAKTHDTLIAFTSTNIQKLITRVNAAIKPKVVAIYNSHHLQHIELKIRELELSLVFVKAVCVELSRANGKKDADQLLNALRNCENDVPHHVFKPCIATRTVVLDLVVAKAIRGGVASNCVEHWKPFTHLLLETATSVVDDPINIGLLTEEQQYVSQFAHIATGVQELSKFKLDLFPFLQSLRDLAAEEGLWAWCATEQIKCAVASLYAVIAYLNGNDAADNVLEQIENLKNSAIGAIVLGSHYLVSLMEEAAAKHAALIMSKGACPMF